MTAKANTDIKGVLRDTVGGGFLIVAMLAVFIALIFVARIPGTAGFVIYTVAAFALATFCLYRSLKDNLSEVSRIWYGILGGMAAWTVLELGELLGFAGIECEEGVLLLLLAGMVTYFLWKVFPLGAKFFIFIFFINWGGHVVIKAQDFLGEIWGIFNTTLVVYSWLAIPLALITIYLACTKCDTREKRFYAAGWLYLFIFTAVHMLMLA